MNDRERYERVSHISGKRPEVTGLPVMEDVDRELRAHLEQTVEDLVAQDWEPEAALEEARRRFGDMEKHADASRQSSRRRDRRLHVEALMDTILHDTRLTIRSLLRRPGFSLAAILILGVGIGATVAIYTVFDTALLRPLPYRESHRLIRVGWQHGISPVEFDYWRENTSSYASLAAVRTNQVNLQGEVKLERLGAALVTDGFLEQFDGQTLLGRMFEAGDFVGEPGVAILDYGWWKSRWAGDSDVIGRTIILDGRLTVVAGVLTQSFLPPEGVMDPDVDIWLPLDVRRPDLQSRGYSILTVAGRLRKDVSMAAAQSEADDLIESLANAFPGQRYRYLDNTIKRYSITPLHIATIRSVAAPIILLLGAVGFMLLIACANVANLLLARSISRSREIALRGALGASQPRLVLQFLSEGVILALAGGVIGVILARIGVDLFNLYGPRDLPLRLANIAVDSRILTAALVISMLTGVMSGIIPALRVSGWDLARMLREVSIGLTQVRQNQRIQSFLVTVEVALALVLTFGAGLLMRSLVEMVRDDPGFETADLITVPVRLKEGFTREQRNLMSTLVLDRIRAIPGVEGAAAAYSTPFEYLRYNYLGWTTGVRDVERPDEPEPFETIIHPVTDGYFETLKAEMAHGRTFMLKEGLTNDQVAVINTNAAQRLFNTTEAVGKRIELGGNQTYTVIGVHQGIRHWGTTQPIGYEVYVPDPPIGSFMERIRYLVRSSQPLGELAPAIQQAIWSVDPNISVDRFISMEERVGIPLVRTRFLLFLLLIFSIVGLALAGGGIYATMLFWVNQRKREIGVRLAMGAGVWQVVHLTVWRALRLTLVGIAAGVAFVIATSFILSSIIWGVSRVDPMTLVAVSLIILGVAVVATLLPAWRASTADPVEVLRAE